MLVDELESAATPPYAVPLVLGLTGGTRSRMLRRKNRTDGAPPWVGEPVQGLRPCKAGRARADKAHGWMEGERVRAEAAGPQGRYAKPRAIAAKQRILG